MGEALAKRRRGSEAEPQKSMKHAQDMIRKMVARATLVPMDQLLPERDLLMEGILDSLQVVSLAEELERCFGILLDPFDLSPENFASLASLETLVLAKLGKDTQAPIQAEARRRAI